MDRPNLARRIPSWFNLEAYDRLSSLSANGWLYLLADLRMLLDEQENYYLDEFERGLDLEALEATFVRFQDGEHAKWVEWKKEDYLDSPDVYSFGSVQSLSNSVVAHMSSRLEKIPSGAELMERVRRIADLEDKRDFKGAHDAEEDIQHLEEFGRTPFFVSLRGAADLAESGENLPRDRTLSVNLRAPDDILRKDFDRWLQAMRSLQDQQAAKRIFTESDFKRWIRNGYVPLLVLSKWKELTGAKITYGDLCEAAFPRMRRVEVDDVRKTLLPNARAWATLETIDALAAQAASEEQKSRRDAEE
ncbi:DUF6387 family protein [Stenotrophomonas maltophilia]|uniref:DUF6387 family protein n=1 Tax=Stenotrophomonas maltophilia TaxID=40324 RepID=UPI0003766DBB|nr:DUF6387 family protein [Stenotrophomonas maltophilia]MCU1151013.1 hypothetical protein [Stenotrophomonas maltophilia]UQA70068.1 hypothetical protein K1516_19395 [Stenotrophomonas maltophilia]